MHGASAGPRRNRMGGGLKSKPYFHTYGQYLVSGVKTLYSSAPKRVSQPFPQALPVRLVREAREFFSRARIAVHIHLERSIWDVLSALYRCYRRELLMA